MPLSITIDLSDKDIERFRAAQASAEASAKSADEIVKAAADLLKSAETGALPDFIRQRLEGLDSLIAMLNDEGFALPEDDRKHVVSALVYFVNPQDAIPDHTPVLGYLDDAIMIELCLRQLHNEIEAYEDFCDFRQHEAERRGLDPATVGRADFLEARREELLNRIHRRRERDYGVGYGASSGYGRAGYTRSWRPSLIKVR
ncbi:MAG: YkvA family protein [Lysobacterales bacterium]